MEPQLTVDEVVLLKTWLWEHLHRREDGPAHLLARDNGVDLTLCLVVASPLLAVNQLAHLENLLASPQPQIPRTWPWPNLTLTEILQSLRDRVHRRLYQRRPLAPPAVFGILLLGIILTALLSWVEASPVVAGVGAFLGAVALIFSWDEFKARQARRTSQRVGTNPETSDEEARKKRSKHNGLIREHEGWDHFILDLGVAEAKYCKVCGEETEGVRNIPGIPGYINLMCGLAEDHDLFICKHRNEAWHRQALELQKMAAATPSPTIERQLEEEIRAILSTRRPSKESWAAKGPRTMSITG
jgi:hypothetical protein